MAVAPHRRRNSASSVGCGTAGACGAPLVLQHLVLVLASAPGDAVPLVLVAGAGADGAGSSSVGTPRVISDCHFVVRLIRFMPDILTYSVADN